MNAKTFLDNLTSKVFKLLPMRENAEKAGRDSVEFDNLGKYVNSVCYSMKGACSLFEELNSSQYATAVANVAFLAEDVRLDFAEWRRIVLRTSRILKNLSEQEG